MIRLARGRTLRIEAGQARARRLRRALPVLLVALLAASCASDDGDGSPTSSEPDDKGGVVTNEYGDQSLELTEPKKGGTLNVGLITSADTLDPMVNISPALNTIGGWIFGRLVTLDRSGEVVPDLAESLTTEDGSVWTMVLPSDLTFSDGTPLDADAVVAHFERLTSPDAQGEYAGQLAAIQSVTAPDDTTVVFELSAPWSDFGGLLALGANSFVESPASVKEWGADVGLHPVGAGPYMVEDFQPGGVTTLVPNPEYVDPSVQYLDKIVVSPILDSQARFAALQSGDIDVALSQSGRDFERAADADLAVLKVPSTTATNIVWDASKAPFDDPRMREAIIRSINLSALNDVVYDGSRVEMTGIVPASNPFYAETDWPGYDIEAAKALVEEYTSETGKPAEFTMTVWGSPEYTQQAELIQQMVGEAGIKLNLENSDQATMVTSAYSGNYESQLRYYGMGFLPSIPIEASFQSESPANISSYSNAEVDDLLVDVRRTLDSSAKTDLFAQIQQQLTDDLVMAPLLEQNAAFLVGDRVGSFPGLDAGSIDGFDVRQVWLR